MYVRSYICLSLHVCMWLTYLTADMAWCACTHRHLSAVELWHYQSYTQKCLPSSDDAIADCSANQLSIKTTIHGCVVVCVVCLWSMENSQRAHICLLCVYIAYKYAHSRSSPTIEHMFAIDTVCHMVGSCLPKRYIYILHIMHLLWCAWRMWTNTHAQ